VVRRRERKKTGDAIVRVGKRLKGGLMTSEVAFGREQRSKGGLPVQGMAFSYLCEAFLKGTLREASWGEDKKFDEKKNRNGFCTQNRSRGMVSIFEKRPL